MSTLGKGVRSMLVIFGVLGACIVAGAVAVPALATNEVYECGSCTVVNGKDNFVKNNFTINHSGGGVCDKLWEKFGGSYFEVGSSCVSGGNTAHVCALSEFTGHGEATNGTAGNLKGRQDNFAGCE
jgi:hypothetical protein